MVRRQIAERLRAQRLRHTPFRESASHRVVEGILTDVFENGTATVQVRRTGNVKTDYNIQWDADLLSVLDIQTITIWRQHYFYIRMLVDRLTGRVVEWAPIAQPRKRCV